MADRIGVIGAGIVGLAVARRLGEVERGAELTVLDKENQVGVHQTGHNSGVAHAGVYYTPGSLKAKLCRRGIELLKPYCEQRGIAYEECGKLIVARDPDELGRLDEIERRATENGVPGLRRLGPAQMVEIEPYVRGCIGAALAARPRSSTSTAVTRAYADDVRAAGGTVRLGFEVAGIDRANGEVRVRSASGEELAFDRLVVCGGLQSDRLAQMAGEGREPWIVPFRGEYYKLIPERRGDGQGPDLSGPGSRVPVPRRALHTPRRRRRRHRPQRRARVQARGLPAHRLLGCRPAGRAQVKGLPSSGPQALAHGRCGDVGLASPTRAFIARARDFIPALTVADVEPAHAGVRAQALDPDGSLVDDFRITRAGGLVLVRNAPLRRPPRRSRSPSTSSISCALQSLTRVGRRNPSPSDGFASPRRRRSGDLDEDLVALDAHDIRGHRPSAGSCVAAPVRRSKRPSCIGHSISQVSGWRMPSSSQTSSCVQMLPTA